MLTFRARFRSLAILLASSILSHVNAADSQLHLNLRSRVRTNASDATTYRIEQRSATWDAKKASLIICDMCDEHWCRSLAMIIPLVANDEGGLFCIPGC